MSLLFSTLGGDKHWADVQKYALLKRNESDSPIQDKCNRSSNPSIAQLAKFASPETYISGTTALSIPDEGRSGGDWHFVEAFLKPQFYIHSAGTQGSLVNTNPILGARMVVGGVLKNR